MQLFENETVRIHQQVAQEMPQDPLTPRSDYGSELFRIDELNLGGRKFSDNALG